MHRMLSEMPGVTSVEPEGAFYCFPDLSGLVGTSEIPDTLTLAARLLDEHDIRVQAERDAALMLAQAEQRSASIRADADEYAERTLRELAEQEQHLSRVIANGIQVLEAHRREQTATAQELAFALAHGAQPDASAPVSEGGGGEAEAAG